MIEAFKKFQDLGFLEIITCGATHGYFPILYVNEKTVRAQIGIGVQTYKKYFGRNPRGIWLPECGYVPEVDKYLKEFGIEYIITETHGVLYADPTPIYGTFAPIVSPNNVVAFARDVESSRQVWSSVNGYPGDYNYREFYRDIGYDEDYEYVKPYIASNGARVHTGIKYYRITGDTDNKDYYDVQWAKDSAEKQAGHFLDCRNKQIENIASYMENPPIILCPYDAELYGHWWYEGPYWLYILFKKIYYDKCNFKLITPGEYIDKYPEMQVSTPCRSSWGANGYSEVWLNQENDYVHRHLHKIGDRMCELVNEFPNVKNKLLLIVNSDLYQVELNNETNQATASLVTPPNFIQLLRDEYDYYYPYNIVETNGLIYQLYYARKNNTDYQYLSVMNPSTNEFIYEGRIILRSDQGLVNNYQLKSLD